ncbi:DUF2125 domain-containing protein [Yoonia sp. SS1-5]|uniref:DUF2125 domain-containing protein n=1 Tax=Yoonia rhodophyticola TaxID=3137370 RepID=A0AAN0NKY3_9RHOB
MKRLTFLVVALAVLYSGYWFFGARAVEQGARGAIENAQSQGWQIDYASLNTIGFPSRFDTTVQDIAVASPDARWAWRGPFVQLFALSYQPHKVIAVLPPDHSLRWGQQDILLSSDGLRASAAVRPNPDLPLQNLTIEGGAIRAVSDLGLDIRVANLLGAVRAAGDAPQAYDVYVDLQEVALPPGLLAQIADQATLSDVIDSVVVDGSVSLDRPLDRHFATDGGTLPYPEQITVKSGTLNWGDLILKLDGTLDFDATGTPQGRVTLRTGQWQKLITLMVDAGLMDQGAAPTLTILAGSMVGPDGSLDLPVTFQGGLMSIGPIPAGPAPRFW